MKCELVLGDIHLQNSISDKIDKILNYIKTIFDDMEIEIDSVFFLGDIIDVEYFSWKKILYLYNFFPMVSKVFNINKIYVLKGNHDKFSKDDNVGNSVIPIICKYDDISFHFIEYPEKIDNILMIPHYYFKENFYNNEKYYMKHNTKFIFSHSGLKNVFGVKNKDELVVEDLVDLYYNDDVVFICGHQHKSAFSYKNNILFLGAIKSSIFEDTGLFFTVVLIDSENINNMYILHVPYHELYYTIRINNENYTNVIDNLIDKLYIYNRSVKLYRYNFDKKSFEKIKEQKYDYMITEKLNLKIIIDNIDLNTVDEYLEFSLRKYNDLYMLNLKLNKIFVNNKIKFKNNVNNENKLNKINFTDKIDEIIKNITKLSEEYNIHEKKIEQCVKKISNSEKRIFSEYLNFIGVENEDDFKEMFKFS